MQKCLQKTLFHYTILPFNLGMIIKKNWEVKGHPWFNPDRPIQDTSSFKGSKFQMKKYVTKLRRDANKLVFFADIFKLKTRFGSSHWFFKWYGGSGARSPDPRSCDRQRRAEPSQIGAACTHLPGIGDFSASSSCLHHWLVKTERKQS
jgi:hypothetical protein